MVSLCLITGFPNSSLHNETIAIEGRKVRLTCNITNDADAVNPKVNWYKNNKLVKEVENHVTIYENAQATDMLQSVLQFDPVHHTDSGEYICRAYSDPGFYTEASTLLIVKRKCISLLYNDNNQDTR